MDNPIKLLSEERYKANLDALDRGEDLLNMCNEWESHYNQMAELYDKSMTQVDKLMGMVNELLKLKR